MDKKANEKLREWLKAEGRKSLWLASKLHVNANAVSSWLTGRNKPQMGFRLVIEEITGGAIKSEEWK